MGTGRDWRWAVPAIRACGTAGFYGALLELVGRIVRHDVLSLVRYARFAAPDILIPSDFDPELKRRYLSGLYRFDPFHKLWVEQGSAGVACLRDLAPDGLWRSPYAVEFLRDARIADEICVFLPPLGGTSVAVIVDRAKGAFRTAEVARLRELFPLLAALHDNHLEAILHNRDKAPIEAALGAKPWRLVDKAGVELFASDAWSAPRARGPVHRTVLPADFGPAPGGSIEVADMAAGPGRPAAGELPEALGARLTPRERQVVALTLQGHPRAAIAKRLGLTAGTVKNHRLKIFQKLDITTERELFLAHIGGLHGEGASAAEAGDHAASASGGARPAKSASPAALAGTGNRPGP